MSARQSYKNLDFHISAVCHGEAPARGPDVVALDEVPAERRLFLATQSVCAADAAGATLFGECLARLRDRDGTVWWADQFLPVDRCHLLLRLVVDLTETQAPDVFGVAGGAA